MKQIFLTMFMTMFMLVAALEVAGQTLPYAASGRVTDVETGKAVEGAYVTMDGTPYSTVTNSEGRFIVKSDRPAQGLSVSRLGYKSLRATAGSNLKLKLQPTSITLADVVVMPTDPQAVLLAALARIDSNYCQAAERDRCFYRETVKKGRSYIFVAEAVTDMYKTGYQRDWVGGDAVELLKGRRLVSPKPSDTLGVKIAGGPVQSVDLDLVKNRQFLLNRETLMDYALTMDVPVSIGDRPQWNISITPAHVQPWAMWTGHILVDRETLAISSVRLSLDMSDKDKATQYMLLRKPRGVHFAPKELSIVVNYVEAEGKMRLSYVRSTFRFSCDWKRRLFRKTNYHAVDEIVITDRDTSGDAQRIKGRDSFRQSQSLMDQVARFSDPDYWRDYNIIAPTESLEHAVGKLSKANRKAAREQQSQR